MVLLKKTNEEVLVWKAVQSFSLKNPQKKRRRMIKDPIKDTLAGEFDHFFHRNVIKIV